MLDDHDTDTYEVLTSKIASTEVKVVLLKRIEFLFQFCTLFQSDTLIESIPRL